MIISMGCDHGGFLLKEHIKKYLTEQGHEIKDFGCHSLDRLPPVRCRRRPRGGRRKL